MLYSRSQALFWNALLSFPNSVWEPLRRLPGCGASGNGFPNRVWEPEKFKQGKPTCQPSNHQQHIKPIPIDEQLRLIGLITQKLVKSKANIWQALHTRIS